MADQAPTKNKSTARAGKRFAGVAMPARNKYRMTPAQVENGIRAVEIKRPSLAETVREEILGRILSGKIQPGERIVEMRIAEDLGTSQAPVREALRALEVIGVIESSKNRGARVRMLGAKELAEITVIRAELEGYAATLAAGHLKDNTAELERCVAAMRTAAKIGDMRRFAEANTAFHRHIVAATDNGTLLEIWTRLDVKAHTIMNVLRGHRDLVRVAESHWPIIEALKTGNSRAARGALRKHILDLKLTVR